MKTQREFKFRAWDGKAMRYPAAENYVVQFNGTIGEFNHLTQKYTTKNWELMQLTGLKDKNGREIYEGDVIRYEQWHGGVEHTMAEAHAKSEGKTIDWFKNGVILWHNEAANWIYRDTNDISDMSYWGNTGITALAKEGEVIGDIYRNPELLK